MIAGAQEPDRRAVRTETPPLPHLSFAARAKARPDAVAVRYGERAWTYRRLDEKANALARRLRACGVAAGARVAVCLEPSLELPLALLAVHKAGGAYAPLDPTHPEERLRALIGALRPAVLIARSALLPKLIAGEAAALPLDDGDAPQDGWATTDLGEPGDPAADASVFFTSGTTGAPKGVVASYANIAYYIASARERYGFSEAEIIPALARSSFSISLFELLSPLAAGGTLLMLDRRRVLEPASLAKTLEGVTAFHAGPSLLKALLAHIKAAYPGFEAFARVRHASSGGDMVPPEVLEGLKTVFPSAEVFVIYGCSEISCMGCTFEASRARPVEKTYVGRPFPGVEARVLDAARLDVPAGGVGEIAFSGPGVTKGYLDLAQKTSERFVTLDGRRFYLTGDVGRFNDDGLLEILGRSDFQVKIRGMRVEPAEVELALRRAPGVRDGVVAAFSLGDGEKALAAYVVPDPGGSLLDDAAVAAIREHMARHLPDYMQPAEYVALERLPLNENMKVDRKALPAPPPRRRRPGAEGAPPLTETERRLAALWSRRLRVEGVARGDRFFDLGGDSLAGLQLLVDVRRELGAELQGLDVVRETLEGMAALCDAKLGRAPAAPAAEDAGAAAPEPLMLGELYGVFHAASAGARPAAGVGGLLVCPPIGQDYARARFVLRRLAERAARAGAAVLCFDFFACGDSQGDLAEGGLGRWRRDVIQAYDELRRHAGSAPVAAVGARLGAMPLALASADRAFDRLVLWDPCARGSRFLDEARKDHDAFIGRWRRLFRPPRPIGPVTELLGLTLPEAEAEALEAAALAQPRAPRVTWLATSEAAHQRRTFEALSAGQTGWTFEAAARGALWRDVTRLADPLPDTGLSQALARLALEAS